MISGKLLNVVLYKLITCKPSLPSILPPSSILINIAGRNHNPEITNIEGTGAGQIYTITASRSCGVSLFMRHGIERLE